MEKQEIVGWLSNSELVTSDITEDKFETEKNEEINGHTIYNDTYSVMMKIQSG
jgi:hypothetical protein